MAGEKPGKSLSSSHVKNKRLVLDATVTSGSAFNRAKYDSPPPHLQGPPPLHYYISIDVVV